MTEHEDNRVHFLLDHLNVTGQVTLNEEDMLLILRHQRELGIEEGKRLASEKQIPKKPINDSKPFYRLGEPYYDWLCPICNKWLAYECDTQRTSIHHCPCGQALDWGEGESE